MSTFKKFIEERRLVKTEVDRKLVLKEIEGATSDLGGERLPIEKEV